MHTTPKQMPNFPAMLRLCWGGMVWSQAGSCSSAGTRSEGVLEGFGRGRVCMKIASEQDLIAKINRLQQAKREHLKYEVLSEI